MSDKKYWNSLDQLEGDSAFIEEAQSEFKKELPVDEFLAKDSLVDTASSRRDFLKFMGFSLSAATLAACETPVTKAIPYVIKPEEVTPGIANWYASSYNRGGGFASILVKTREGRPIFIQANDAYPEALRGVSAKVNASVLELYDDNRYGEPSMGEEEQYWEDIDADVISKLNAIKAKGGNVRVLSASTSSPSTQKVFQKFSEKFGGTADVDVYDEKGAVTGTEAVNNQVVYYYDAQNYEGIVNANNADFGVSAIPSFDFTKAKVIVGINADFLSSWLDATANSKGYTQKRNPDNSWMSMHYQFETNMTTAGAAADVRGAIKPSENGEVAKLIYNILAKKAGIVTLPSAVLAEDDNNVVTKAEQAANDLWENKGNSLVICGSHESGIQQIVNAINNLLGNYGKTLSLGKTNNLYNSNAGVNKLISEMNSGAIDALIVYGTNPAYSLPSALGFNAAMSKVGLTISLADRPDETSVLCNYICPDHFYLESWNDFQPYTGIYAMAQPTIKPLFNTRQAQESLLIWSGAGKDYYSFLKNNWKTSIISEMGDQLVTEESFNRAQQKGVYLIANSNAELEYKGNALVASKSISTPKSGWEAQMYFSNAIGDGTQANNPHLQELPDPITKISWDNYVTMAPSDMRENDWETRTAQETPASLITITINGVNIELPAVSSPGQKKGTVGIALGYGRSVSGKTGATGKNAYTGLTFENGTYNYSASDISLNGTDQTYQIASVQTHHTMMGRKIVNETSLATFKETDKNDEHKGWNKDLKLQDGFGRVTPVKEMNLWDDHGIERGHRWGLNVDLNACLGCGACVTACHIENNVAIVGKDEIRRTRSMFWLRIDRYYSSDTSKASAKEDGTGVMDMYAEMEIPSDYPDVVFQPVMCQHCNHAPCETVCPVAATTHSEEGLNQMTYNRCIGTRYCAANCPYKVRRFNWFNYNKDPKFTDFNPTQNDLSRMVLNPDVVVRSRGVIEKCSFCVQKIQAGKLAAKKAKRPVQDGDVVSACASACPTNAISFGDLNDSKSKVRANFDNERSYFMIEEVGTQPNVAYMTKVRNRKA